MIDLGFSGPRFTWTNKRELNALIQERIDRFFMNPEWCTIFLEARVTHLTQCHSDPCPVLLESNPSNSIRLPRPFRFQSCWITDLDLPRVVSQAWDLSNHLREAISNFEKDAVNWNKNHFGNVFGKKRRLMARLRGIQKEMAVRPTASLIDLEKQLLRDLDTILNQELELWALKSRVNWLVQRDRNTSFYHISTLVRRKRNQIDAIKNSVGEWIFEERGIMEVIRKGYEELFTSSNTAVPFVMVASEAFEFGKG